VTAGQNQQPAQSRGLLVIYSALMLAMLLAALDQTIVATALPARCSAGSSWTAKAKGPSRPGINLDGEHGRLIDSAYDG
jgi:hypothetical protein